MKAEADMVTVADFIDQVLTNITNEEQVKTIGEKVKEFSRSFPEFDDTF